jgi:general nucleoside transport system ATP-binding protein
VQSQQASSMNISATPRLQLRHITKRYPSVVANDDVSLTVASGEIHAVLGENGAGKSTLMKIIYGAVKPDAGEVMFDGAPHLPKNPREARALGISMVFQHFSLFETLSVAENIWLGLDQSMTLDDVRAQIKSTAEKFGLPLEADRPVHTLSVGERQRVEIMRALLMNPKLLILDEPTSVLTPQAVEKLFDTLRKLAASGCSILYISHKLDEIRALCTNCTVLRGGKVTGVVDPRNESNASLSRLMIGTEPPQLQHRDAKLGDVALAAKNLSLVSEAQFGTDLHDISLNVRSGEIVGIAGVSGNGQQELLAALSGENANAPSGSVMLFGNDIAAKNPQTRRAAGLHFVPEERLGRGAVPVHSLAMNALLTRAGGLVSSSWLRWVSPKQNATLARDVIARFNVKAGGVDAAAKSLSGGNLQKYIVGREIDAKPKVLIVSQPTWGVDVGAAAQIRGELLKLRDEGCAVLVVSEELDELFELCDRLHVIAKGKLSPSIATRDASVELIGEWMSGLWGSARVA